VQRFSAALSQDPATGGAQVNLVVEHRARRSKPIALDVVASNPTILGTNQFYKGNAESQNEDGTANNVQHPAARGSVVTLYVTG
jgi:uncharacterized protein (TIGR03437 family)